MQKRRLGRTGLLVSRIGFGGIPIITLSKREAESVVTYAFEQGITYFDTGFHGLVYLVCAHTS